MLSWQSKVELAFERVESVSAIIMPDWFVDGVIRSVFSRPGMLAHVIFFLAQLLLHWDQNTVTNIISWEAIFLAILIGVQAARHQKTIAHHLVNKVKEKLNA